MPPTPRKATPERCINGSYVFQKEPFTLKCDLCSKEFKASCESGRTEFGYLKLHTLYGMIHVLYRKYTNDYISVCKTHSDKEIDALIARASQGGSKP